MTNLLTIFQGMIMGIAEVIPGVSGSTLALVMGIYYKFIDLLHQVSEFGKELLKLLLGKSSRVSLWKKFVLIDFKFGIQLVIGMAISVALFSHLISDLLDSSPQYVYAFFFGLIIASIPIPWNEMTRHTYREYLIVGVSFVSTFILLGLTPTETKEDPSLLLLLFGGIVGISGMVLPGVSGSFILLTLGLYDYIIGMIKDLTRLGISSQQLLHLATFGAGLVIGFIGFVRILKWALKNYPSELLAALIGLMLASLRVLWPFLELSDGERIQVLPWEVDPIISLGIGISFLLGLLAVWGLRRFSVSQS